MIELRDRKIDTAMRMARGFVRDERAVYGHYIQLAGVLRHDDEARKAFVQARIARSALETVNDAVRLKVMSDDDADALKDTIVAHVPDDEEIGRFFKSYVTLAIGYYLMGKVINAGEAYMYAQALQGEDPVTNVFKVATLARGLGMGLKPLFTLGLGAAQGIDTKLQSAVSLVPFVGHYLALHAHAGLIAGSSIHGMRSLARRVAIAHIVHYKRMGVEKVRNMMSKPAEQIKVLWNENE